MVTKDKEGLIEICSIIIQINKIINKVNEFILRVDDISKNGAHQLDNSLILKVNSFHSYEF